MGLSNSLHRLRQTAWMRGLLKLRLSGEPHVADEAQPVPTDRPFLVNPQNQKFLSGETGTLVGSPPLGCVVLIPVLFGLFSVAAFALAHHQCHDVQFFKEHAAQAQGTVIHKRVHTSAGMVDVETGMVESSDDYLVKYRFEGQTQAGVGAFVREAAVPEEVYRRLTVGSHVAVRYDRADPSSSRLIWELQMRMASVLTIMGATLAGTGILGSLAALAGWRSNRQMAREGRILPGRVVSCTASKAEEGYLQVQLSYCFEVPPAREITAAVRMSRQDLTEATLPPPLTPLMVLYRSDASYRVL